MGRLIFVGLGLTASDLTDAGRQAIEAADEVVAEFYTSRLVGMGPKEVAQWLGRPVRFLRRHEVEEQGDAILEAAKLGNVCFLTGGDAMTATTHNELRFRAQAKGIPTSIVHGVSILTAAAGEVGLHSYKFGRTTTLVAPQGNYVPDSPFEVIERNHAQGLHTLVLLDLDSENDRFMLAPDAARQIAATAKKRGHETLGPDYVAVACARIGSRDARIVAAPLAELAEIDLGGPLHCVIVPGNLHFTEEDALGHWRPDADG